MPNEGDLMFQTEVDVKKLPPRSVTTMEQHTRLEDMMDQSRQNDAGALAPFVSDEDREFKVLLKKLVHKTQTDVLQMEDSILKKMRVVS